MKNNQTKRGVATLLALVMVSSACTPYGKSNEITATSASLAVRNWSEFSAGDEDSYLDGETGNVEASKEEIDLLVYRQVTSQNISSGRDDRSLLEMDLTNMLATEFPDWTHEQIQEKVNQFGQEYQRRTEGAANGINPTRQNIADQMEIASEIVGDIAGYVPNPKAFLAKWTMKTIAKGTRGWADSPDFDYMAQSQWSAATDSDRVRNRQDMIIKEYAELQTKDLRVRQVAYMIHDRRLGTSLNYDAKTQFQRNPNALVLQNTEDIKNDLGKMAEFLEQNIGPNGALSVRFDKMEDFLEKKFDGIQEDIRSVGESVLRFESKFDKFLDFSMEERRRQHQEAFEKFEAQQIEMGKRAAVQLLGNVIGLGNAKAGHRIVTVGNALLDIHSAFEQYSKSMMALEVGMSMGAAQMGTNLIMATNVFTAGLAIAGAFGSSGSNKKMMKMLAQMFKFLEKFRTEMHQRFDVIDERLNDIYDTMLAQFHQVFMILNGIQGDIAEVKIQIRNVMTKLAEIENRILILDSRVQNFSSDYWNYLGESTVSDCIELRQRTPQAIISVIEFSKCLGSFAGLATTIAQNSSNTNANLVASLPAGNNSDAKLKLLRGQNFRLNPTVLRDLLLSPEYQAEGVAIPRGSLPQISIWNSAVKGYSEMLRIWPEFSLAGTNTYSFDSDARKLLAPMKNVWSFTTAIRHPALIEKLTLAYEDSLRKVEAEFARVYAKEIENSLNQMTYRGELTSSVAPSEAYLEIAGMPETINHCTQKHLFKALALPSEFRKKVPAVMRQYAWTHPKTTSVCYEIDEREQQSSTPGSKTVRTGRGGVDGDPSYDTIKWTDYKCTVKFVVNLVWKTEINGKEIVLRTDAAQADSKSWVLRDQKCKFGLVSVPGKPNEMKDLNDAPKTVREEPGKYEKVFKALRFSVSNEMEKQFVETQKNREAEISLTAVRLATQKYISSFLGKADGDPDLRVAQQELDYRLEMLRATLSLAYPESIRQSEALPGFLFGENGLRSAFRVGEVMQLHNQSDAEITYPLIGEEKYPDYLQRRVGRVGSLNGKPRLLLAFESRYVDAERLAQIFKDKAAEFGKNEVMPFEQEVKEIEVLDQQL